MCDFLHRYKIPWEKNRCSLVLSSCYHPLNQVLVVPAAALRRLETDCHSLVLARPWMTPAAPLLGYSWLLLFELQ
jgi:hypothetical protein